MKNQQEEGHWKVSANRPPLEESNATCTALAVYYMRKFAGETQREEVESQAARAKSWLLSASPVSQEDINSRFGGLALLGAKKDEIEAARRAVLEAQRDDGGWGQLAEMKSDAYATGQTLFTLQRAGLSTSHPAYERGVRFLLKTQSEDGSWRVESRSKPVQLYFDNGDPHGKHQFISIPATCWATVTLALALPRHPE